MVSRSQFVLTSSTDSQICQLTHYRSPVALTISTIGKEERTREFVVDGLKEVQKAFKDEGLIANLRLETYEGERYFHVPPPTDD